MDGCFGFAMKRCHSWATLDLFHWKGYDFSSQLFSLCRGLLWGFHPLQSAVALQLPAQSSRSCSLKTSQMILLRLKGKLPKICFQSCFIKEWNQWIQMDLVMHLVLTKMWHFTASPPYLGVLCRAQWEFHLQPNKVHVGQWCSLWKGGNCWFPGLNSWRTSCVCHLPAAQPGLCWSLCPGWEGLTL